MKTDKKILWITVIGGYIFLYITMTGINQQTKDFKDRTKHGESIKTPIKTLILDLSQNEGTAIVHIGRVPTQEFKKGRKQAYKDDFYMSTNVGGLLNYEIKGDTMIVNDDGYPITSSYSLPDLENLVVGNESKVALLGVTDTLDYVRPDLNINIQGRGEVKTGWGWRSNYHVKISDEGLMKTANLKIVKSLEMSDHASFERSFKNDGISDDFMVVWLKNVKCQDYSFVKYGDYFKTSKKTLRQEHDDAIFTYTNI